MRFECSLCCCLVLAVVVCMVDGVKTTTSSSSSSSAPSKALAKDYVQKFLADSYLPPIEVDMQLDFEIAPAPGNTGSNNKKRSARQASKPMPKPKPKKKVDKKATKLVVPLSSMATRQISKKKKKSRTVSQEFVEIQRRIHTACQSIFEHKYAGILWASLFIVWVPLLLIFLVNKWIGKEAFIDILVQVLPEGFPARYIEMVIEDALWVGIFGVSIVATLGTFLVEMASLGIDIVRTLSQDSRRKKKGNLWK